MGEYRRPDGKLLSPERKPDLTPGGIYRFEMLEIGVMAHLRDSNDHMRNIAEIAVAGQHCLFRFPVPIRTALVHSICCSPNGRRWLHAFLFADKSTDLTNSLGQISLCSEPATDKQFGATGVALLEAFPAVKSRLPAAHAGDYGPAQATEVELGTVEPFSAPDINVHDAMELLRYFGSQYFRLNASPRSLFIYALSNRLPEYSFANGWLLKCSVDVAQSLGSEEELRAQVVASATLEYGGEVGIPKLEVIPISFVPRPSQ